MPFCAELQSRLGYTFQDEALLRLALTHPSVSHEQNQPTPHNQRLEFLGDSVISVIISSELYQRHPGADEGALTKMRAKLVNAAAFTQHGRDLNLGAQLLMSRGEVNTGGRERPSSLADAFESLVGAIFLDGGLAAAREFILREFSAHFAEIGAWPGIDNPKGELQEFFQGQSLPAPEYALVAANGADHDREFECAVLHNGAELARGRGKSKKAAESEAAQAALQILKTPPAAE